MVEVTIETLGAQGDGVTPDGLFVAGSLPGERVRVEPMGHRASLLDVLDPSAERVDPVCSHFGACGGCALQHASDGLLAEWKRDIVRRALAARGLGDVPVREVLTSPAGTRRRVVFTGRRTKKSAIVGFHARGSDAIVAVTECPVSDAALTSVMPGLRQLVLAGASRKAELRLSVTVTDAGLDVAATGGKPVEGPMYGQLVAVAATSDLARLSWDGEEIVTRRPPGHLMGRTRLVPAPGGFLQATIHGEVALVEAVRAATASARSVADLFAGSGTFALPLSEMADVHAVEADAAALEALDMAWRQAEGVHRITTETRDLFHRPLLARDLARFDAIVFDPPRVGARAQTAELAKAEIPRVAAVSCNPATFARDARTLVDGGYRLDWVQPVDQFRWSPHVELVAAFSHG